MAQIYYVRSSTGRIKLSKGRRQREKGEIDMHAASEQRMQLNWKCRIFVLSSTYIDRSHAHPSVGKDDKTYSLFGNVVLATTPLDRSFEGRCTVSSKTSKGKTDLSSLLLKIDFHPFKANEGKKWTSNEPLSLFQNTDHINGSRVSCWNITACGAPFVGFHLEIFTPCHVNVTATDFSVITSSRLR